MEWKDIWTEVQIKLKIKDLQKVKSRKPTFARHDIKGFTTTATILKGRLISEIERRLNQRSVTASYLRTDDRLFEPFVDFMVIDLQGREFPSFIFEIGFQILEVVEKYEVDNRLKVNKSHLYFGLALASIGKVSTINASIYWELCQKEEAHTLGAAYNPALSLQNTINKFTSAINPIEYGLIENILYKHLLDTYPWFGNFQTNLLTLADPWIFSYFSSGLRNKANNYWLKSNFTEMSKMYAQELLNALCILGESLLKQKPGVTRHTLGQIINHDLNGVNAAVSAIVGVSRPAATGLWLAYPTGTKAEFDTNFPLLITRLKSAPTLSDNEVKAYVIYGIYMLRNKALHDYDPTLVYYTNRSIFLDAIGLALAGVPVLRNI